MPPVSGPLATEAKTTSAPGSQAVGYFKALDRVIRDIEDAKVGQLRTLISKETKEVIMHLNAIMHSPALRTNSAHGKAPPTSSAPQQEKSLAKPQPTAQTSPTPQPCHETYR